MIRVVVTGSECTGKTTLAQALANHYAAPWVPEFARQFVAEQVRAPGASDVAAIARGQIAAEDAALALAPALLIQDTDLLSTVVYCKHYYGVCEAWIETALRERAADLYLLAGIDVPWVADRDQRDRGTRRNEMQDLFRDALRDLDVPFVAISGTNEERLRSAIRAIDALLAT